MSEPAPMPADPAPDVTAQLERRIAEMETAHRARLVRAELKSEAIRHGMVDLDCLKLLDANSVDLDDAGEVRNAATVMRDFKRAKPHLFGEPRAVASSSTATPPAAASSAPRPAMKMTHAEWQAARADLLKRR